MIKLHDIHKSYRTGEQSLHVLKGIDLHIREGELVSIMGSSRLRQVHALEHPRNSRLL
jgi:putative ABC transport system ATP-binding protein